MVEEWNSKNSNEDGEELPLGDAVPYCSIRLLEAFADDAGGSIQEGKQGGEDARRGLAPQQTHADEYGKNEQPFAECFEKLRRVTRGQELPQSFAHCVVFAAESGEGVVESFIGHGQGADAIAGSVFHGCHGLNLLLRRKFENLLREFHGQRVGGVGDAAVEFAVDEIGHAAEEEADGAGDGHAVQNLCGGEFVAPGIPHAGQDNAEDAAVGGHAAFPYAEYPGGVSAEPAPAVLRQPVEEEFAQTSAYKYAGNADESNEIPQLGVLDAVQLFPGKHFEHQVTQNEAGYIGQSIPAERQRCAGDVDDDGIQMVNIGCKCWHDWRAYSTGQGVKQDQNPLYARAMRHLRVSLSKKWGIMKILLAKRGRIVYKYSTHLFFF